MKKILFSFCLLLLSYAAFSQINGNYNYTIGVRTFSIMQMPKILNQTNSKNYVNTYFNGGLIKFNDNQISYRISGGYLKKSDMFYNNCEACEQANGNLIDYSFKIGFEKSFNYARIQPYFAFDIGFRSNTFNGTINNVNVQKSTNNMPYNVEASKDGFVVSPVIGIKINPFKELSVFAESNVDFFYSYERQETITQDVANTRTLNKYNKSEFLLNPISVGIQVHLGSKN